jgi:hypothetical protein
MIYYVYEKATGIYAGSGVEPINNEKYESTTIPLKESVEKVVKFDKLAGKWSWVAAEIVGEEGV